MQCNVLSCCVNAIPTVPTQRLMQLTLPFLRSAPLIVFPTATKKSSAFKKDFLNNLPYRTHNT